MVAVSSSPLAELRKEQGRTCFLAASSGGSRVMGSLPVEFQGSFLHNTEPELREKTFRSLYRMWKLSVCMKGWSFVDWLFLVLWWLCVGIKRLKNTKVI